MDPSAQQPHLITEIAPWTPARTPSFPPAPAPASAPAPPCSPLCWSSPSRWPLPSPRRRDPLGQCPSRHRQPRHRRPACGHRRRREAGRGRDGRAGPGRRQRGELARRGRGARPGHPCPGRPGRPLPGGLGHQGLHGGHDSPARERGQGRSEPTGAGLSARPDSGDDARETVRHAEPHQRNPSVGSSDDDSLHYLYAHRFEDRDPVDVVREATARKPDFAPGTGSTTATSATRSRDCSWSG